MGNIIDYVKWRGDISFDYSPLNEVDNLILSMLSYLDLEAAVSDNYSDVITLKEASDRLFSYGDKVSSLLVINSEDFSELLKLCAESKRFGSLKLMNFVNKVDLDKQMQFSAVVFEVDENSIFVSFRGTDDTIVGWQEDLNMSFMDVIPSQQEALNYLIRAANRFPNKSIYVGGHSKGGNLAVYSSIKAPKTVTDRIIKVFSNDGPGFISSNVSHDLYSKLSDRIISIVPESSIIGMLMDHEEEYIVIRSSASGILQHNGFTWEVLGNNFIHLDSVDTGSRILDRSLSKSLEECSQTDREIMAEAIASVFSNSDALTLTDISIDKFKAMAELVSGYDKLSKESKQTLTGFFSALLKYMMKNATDSAMNTKAAQKISGFLRSRRHEE